MGVRLALGWRGAALHQQNCCNAWACAHLSDFLGLSRVNGFDWVSLNCCLLLPLSQVLVSQGWAEIH